MSISLLSTKVFVPPKREGVIARTHLLEKLRDSVGKPGCFTIVSGPAGFGKTTLLSDFVSGIQQPTAWVSLDEGDNDPGRFWTYVATACQSVSEAIVESVSELLQAPQPLPDETIPTLLINDLASQDHTIIFVLDDFHTIQNPSIHAGMQFLLEHLPYNLHIILSTRTDPPYPLARFRARDRLIEIRTRDLRFNRGEAVKFLNQTMRLDLKVEDVAALEERTEGWAAGLQLAALSMQGRSDIHAFIDAFTGSHLYVAEYLLEEVLRQQSEAARLFLLKTSILLRMTSDLCDAVTGCEDGQATLRTLYKTNAFLIPLDNEGRWFRYHHLFADLLQAHLQQSQPPGAITELHRRAAGWFEKNDLYHEAIQHALAAKDFEQAAQLVESTARPLIDTGQLSQLQTWLEAIPETSFQSHPRLAFFQFWIDALQSKADLSEQTLQEKEAQLKALPPSSANDRLRGELLSVICRAVTLSGRMAEGIRLAREALAIIPADDFASRARTNSALAAAYEFSNQGDLAEPVYRACFEQAIDAGDFRLAASTMMVNGLIQFQSGQLHAAVQTFQAIVDMGARPDISNKYKVFFPAGQGYIGLGIVHLEWNNLETAENFLRIGLDLCRRGGLDGIFIGQINLSRLRQAMGDLEGALEAIRQPEQSGQRVDDFNIYTRNEQIALARGDLVNARQWAAPLIEILNAPAPPQPPQLFLEMIEAAVARVYLAQGAFENTLQLLDRLQATAETGRRPSRLIEVYLLRALALQQQKQGMPPFEAIEHIEQALKLAEPQGYILLFLEEGAPLLPLLKSVIQRQEAPERLKNYARRLLEAAGAPLPGQTVGEAAGLLEPLTPREMEVLALLAAGDSNPDIAEKLTITVRTVKKHTGNIYGKLGASSRIQAVTLARALGLLPVD